MQTAALTLNVVFNATGVMDAKYTDLGNLTLCNLVEGSQIKSWTLTAAQATDLNGKSINQILADANNALGGNGLPGYAGSFANLNALITALNESFDNCVVSIFAASYICK